MQWVHAVNDAWTSIASECHVNNSQSNDATAITINWKNIQCGKDGNLTAIQQTENADPNCATSQTFQAIQKNFSQQLAALEQQANAPPDLTLSVGAVQINASVAVLTNKVMAEMTTLCDSGNAQSNVGRDITMNGDDLSCDTLQVRAPPLRFPPPSACRCVVQGVSQSSSSGAKCAMSVYAGVLQSNKVLQKATMGSSTNQWWTILIVAGIAAAVLGTIVGVVEYLQVRGVGRQSRLRLWAWLVCAWVVACRAGSSGACVPPHGPLLRATAFHWQRPVPSSRRPLPAAP